MRQPSVLETERSGEEELERVKKQAGSARKQTLERANKEMDLKGSIGASSMPMWQVLMSLEAWEIERWERNAGPNPLGL